MGITVYPTPAAGTTAPAGYKLHTGGYSSTGTYTIPNVPAGEYIFSGAPGSKITCADGKVYSGYNIYPNGYSTSSSYFDNYSPLAPALPINVGTPLKIAGTQDVTITTGPLVVSTRLGSRGSQAYGSGAATWNRNKILHNGTKYAFADLATTGTTPVWTSTDGIAWTKNTTTFNIGQCFMLANGIFFAGDTTFTNTFYTSTDAVTWTQRTFPTANSADSKLVAVVYSGGKYVAFTRRSSANTYTPQTFTSTDGVTWTFGASQVGSTPTFSNGDYGVYVAASSTTIVVTGDGYALNPTVQYSSNGTSFSTVESAGTTYYCAGIEYVNGNFVIFKPTNNSTGYAAIAYSTTGTSAFSTWTPNNFNYGNSAYVATGISWDGARYIFTIPSSNSTAIGTIAWSTTLGGTLNTLYPIGNGQSSALGFGITSSTYANGKYFFVGNDFMYSSPSAYNGLCYMSVSFPALSSPNQFALYRQGESTVLN